MKRSSLVVFACLWACSLGANERRMPKRRCVGGHRHGFRVDMDDYWYYCNDGQLENRGCFAQNRRRLKISEKYASNGFETECVVNEDGILRLKYVACVMDGVRYGPEDTWVSEGTHTWYRCHQNGSILSLQLGGCVMGDGEKKSIGEEIVRNHVIYKCSGSIDSGTGMMPKGCMHYAKRYELDETFEDTYFWYTCKLIYPPLPATDLFVIKGGKEATGCIHGGQRIRRGDRYVVNDVIFQCQLHPFPAHQVLGCLRHTQTGSFGVRVGERWMEGFSAFRYLMECRAKGSAMAERKPIACVFVDQTDLTGYSVEPGCFMVLRKEAIACKKEKDGSLTLDTFRSDQLHLAFNINVRLCEPKKIL